MKLEDPPRDRRRFELIGAVMAVVIAATAIGFFVVVILSANDPDPAPAATVPPTLTATPSPTTVLEGIAITRPIEVRSGPRADFAIVTRLAITDSINVLGRSSDGTWLVVAPEDRPSLTGWIPLDAVTGVEVGPLPVIAPPGATPAPGDATLSPDLPDLVVARAFGRDNMLWIEITNQGIVPASGEFRVSIDGDPDVALDVKPGEPLHPDQTLTAAVPGVFLQLRRNMEVRLLPVEGVEEEDMANNTWTGIAGPDLPNDIEIFSAVVDEEPGSHLVVTLRNNSPIPITGTYTVSVRETGEGNELNGRQRTTERIEVGGLLEIPFPEITEIDFTTISVILSTDSIDDSALANNTYPR